MSAKFLSLFLILVNIVAHAEVMTSKFSQRKNKKISNWSLVIPSFVIHGVRPTNEASLAMPRKMDTKGDAVMTPGLGIKYEGNEGELFILGAVKDCYDNLAGTIQYGLYSQFGKNTRLGASFGLYFRETPLVCDTIRNSNGQILESYNCHSMDQPQVNFQTRVNGILVDIIPMPFLHFTTMVYEDSQTKISIKMMSNFVLNEFAFSVPF